MDMGVLLTRLLTILVSIAAVDAEGCFWSGSCYNRWIGGCGTGRVIVSESEDCNGQCPQPQYPACIPFFTHFLCCNEETAIASDECARCENRVDVGNHWMCCSDCSEAKVTNEEAETGFCRSGAQLGIQPKSREVLRWVAREWSTCSTKCGGGVRQRSVKCVGSLEYSPKQLYYVSDSMCQASKMPTREEACNTHQCPGVISHHDKGSKKHKRRRKHSSHHKRGLHLWAIMLISIFTISAVGGLAYGGYVFHKRRTSENHGFVYVMLDSYS